MEEKERAEYLEALHGFVKYREKLGELGIVSEGNSVFFWNALKFDKLIEVMGVPAKVKREGMSSYPFRKVLEIEGIRFMCLYSPDEFGCVRAGTKMVTKAVSKEVKEAEYEEVEEKVEVPVWKCKNGTEIVGD